MDELVISTSKFIIFILNLRHWCKLMLVNRIFSVEKCILILLAARNINIGKFLAQLIKTIFVIILFLNETKTLLLQGNFLDAWLGHKIIQRIIYLHRCILLWRYMDKASLNILFLYFCRNIKPFHGWTEYFFEIISFWLFINCILCVFRKQMFSSA